MCWLVRCLTYECVAAKAGSKVAPESVSASCWRLLGLAGYGSIEVPGYGAKLANVRGGWVEKAISEEIKEDMRKKGKNRGSKRNEIYNKEQGSSSR